MKDSNNTYKPQTLSRLKLPKDPFEMEHRKHERVQSNIQLMSRVFFSRLGGE